MKLFIDFDGKQLVFETNADVALASLSQTFRYMLRPFAVDPIASLGLWAQDGQYILESEATHEYVGIGLDVLLPLLKDEVRLQFMRKRPDLLWMHAGVVKKGAGAMLLAGASGQGKSTLTTRLTAQGWEFLSDDIAPLRMTANTVIPFPQAAVRRIRGVRDVPPGELNLLPRELVDIPSSQIGRGEAAVRAIVFLEYRSGAPPRLSPLTRGEAALAFLRNATNFFDHRAAAVERAVQAVTDVPMFQLSYSDGLQAAKLLHAELAAGIA